MTRLLSPLFVLVLTAPALAGDRPLVPPSSWSVRGQQGSGHGVKLRLPAGLLERIVVDRELRRSDTHPRTPAARAFFRMGSELLFSWSSRVKKDPDGEFRWHHTKGGPPMVVGMQTASSGKEPLYEVDVTECRVDVIPKGFRYRGRLRLSLGTDAYDLLFDLSFVQPEEQRTQINTFPRSDFAGSWHGPYAPGEGALPKAKQKARKGAANKKTETPKEAAKKKTEAPKPPASQPSQR